MDEARRPNVRKVRWDNFDLLKERKSTKEKVTLIVSSIRNSGLARGGTLRVHIGVHMRVIMASPQCEHVLKQHQQVFNMLSIPQ